MPARNDALAAAAELTLAVERLAKATGAKDTVATVGVLKVGPGAVNSVPRTAEMEIDVRDVDGTRRDALVDAILREGEAIASRRNARWSSGRAQRRPADAMREARRGRDGGGGDATRARVQAHGIPRVPRFALRGGIRAHGDALRAVQGGLESQTGRVRRTRAHQKRRRGARARSRGHLWTRRWRARNRTRVGWDRRRRPIDRRNYECGTQATASRVFFR